VHAPRALWQQGMHLGYGFHHTHMRIEHVLCASFIQNVWGESVFSSFFVGKAHVFSRNPDRNYHYKYQPSSFRTGVVQEEDNSRAS